MKANDRAVVNDSPVDCQSREVTEAKFSAENLARPCGGAPPPQPTLRTEKDIGSENPETTTVSGFFRAIIQGEI